MSTAVLETEKLISGLSRAEKAQILQWIVQDLGDAFPDVERITNVAGGAACIVRTRVPIWLLEQTRRLGASKADILQVYPSLRAHGAEIDDAIEHYDMN